MTSRACLLLVLVCALAVAGWPAKKKKNEDETQVLQLPKALPSAVVGETRRLLFYVTPLSAKGLLSQQMRDALKALDRQSAGNTVLAIRAFAAGTGDMRRVRDLISETFTARRQPLPALSLIQAGRLPLEGAQVQLEAIAEGRKDLYAGGLAFVSAQAADSENAFDATAPLAERSLADLQKAIQAAGANASDVLRITCFLSSLENLDATRKVVEAIYSKAAAAYVQTQRSPQRASVSCEAVAGLASNPGRFEARNPEGLRRVEGESQIALVGASHVVLSGTQEAFGSEERDARLAFERLQSALQPLGATLRDVAFTHVYPLSGKMAAEVTAVWKSLFDEARPPAGSVVPVEGLSSLDAGFAVDVVAAKD